MVCPCVDYDLRSVTECYAPNAHAKKRLLFIKLLDLAGSEAEDDPSDMTSMTLWYITFFEAVCGMLIRP